MTKGETMTTSKAVAAITGGSTGIGAATAQMFASRGYAIAILDVNLDRGEKTAAAISAAGGSARFYACDVADASAVDAAAASVEKDLGPAEILVTSAGLIPNTESVMEMDLEAHDRMWRVNYYGTIHACRSFGRQMIVQKRGAIVTLGSINSLAPMPLPAYNPGKLAVARLTQLLAVELGRHGIRVNSVGPTYVMTETLQSRVDSGLRDLKKIMAVHALDSLPTPEDIALAIGFLCSAEARTITGILLPIDSGWHASTSYKTYAGGVPWKE
jgi:NAD(P)-dependent dehydrogenase (short-subunit alcohol dehydrogenase family)